MSKEPAGVLALLAALLIVAGPAGLRAQSLSATEQRIGASVDARLDDADAMLERLVNIDSATLNLDGVRRVGDVLRKELDALGFTTTWVDMPADMHRAGHLVAEHTGDQGKRVLILGHLDTVLQGERFIGTDRAARGSGIADMKGGDVVILFALKALQDAGALNRRRIVVVLTGDEESPGEPLVTSRRDLTDAARRSDVALSFEGSVRNTATIARRGASFWTLDVTGSTGHSMGIFGPERGGGAVFEAARILTAFYEQLRGELYLTFNPAVIAGGTDVDFTVDHGTAAGKLNVVAQRVVVRGDLRFISEDQKDAARARMRDIVGQSLPKTSATITFEDAYPAMSPTPANGELLRQVSAVSVDLGGPAVEPLDAGERGAGDISFAAPLIPGVDGLGVKGEGSHAPGEAADLASLPFLIKRAAIVIHRLTR
jgi:glutamate carboxypeptidase